MIGLDRLSARELYLRLVSLYGLMLMAGCATAPIITQEEYLKNQNTKVAIYPLQNDYYGATDSIIAELYKLGFQVVERTELYRVLSEMKFSMSGMTEYDQIEAGKLLNVDVIIVGSVYTKYKPYYPEQYIPDFSNKYDYIRKAGHDIAEGIKQSQSGLYIYANIRTIDVKTGKIIKAVSDVFIRKQ